MDAESKQKTLDNLTKAETILVAVSGDAGFDGLAAGLALYLSCIKLGKNAQIMAPSPSVGDAQRLYGVDRIGRFEGSKNLIVVVNDAVDNVDKVTYSLEDTKLKIVVHPFPGAKSVTRQQISFEETPTRPHLIFAIGFKSQDQLKQVIAHEQILDPNIWIVNINKQDVGQLFAQVNAFSDQAASICEVTTQIFQQLALPLDEDIAFNLYAGIAGATDFFSPSLTSPTSFESAAWLLKFGAGRASFANPKVEKPLLDAAPVPAQSLPAFSQMPQKPPEDFGKDDYPQPDPYEQPAIEQVERKEGAQENWLKPPKVYKGSKSFDSEK